MRASIASISDGKRRVTAASIVAAVVLLAFGLGVLAGHFCSARTPTNMLTEDDQVALWLARMPYPGEWPIPAEERHHYETGDEWKADGLKIPDIENRLINRLRSGQSMFSSVVYVIALGDVGTEASVPVLTEVIGDQRYDWPTVREAAKSLERLGSLRAVEPLSKLVFEAQDKRKILAITLALTHIGGPQAKATVEKVLKTVEFPEDERGMIEELLECGIPVVPYEDPVRGRVGPGEDRE